MEEEKIITEQEGQAEVSFDEKKFDVAYLPTEPIILTSISVADIDADIVSIQLHIEQLQKLVEEKKALREELKAFE